MEILEEINTLTELKDSMARINYKIHKTKGMTDDRI